MSQRDGGSAFPPNAGSRDDDPMCRGMTLLDWFAGQALAGMTADPMTRNFTWKVFANKTYCAADAMLAERNRRMKDKP